MRSLLWIDSGAGLTVGVLVLLLASWAVLCVIATAVVAPSATPFGLALLLLEGVFVGGLAALEWRHREALLRAE
jgi:hypothetical protein